MIKVYKLKVEGKVYEVELEDVSEKAGHISSNTATAAPQAVKQVETAAAPSPAAGEAVTAPMQAVILEIKVKAGDMVKAGQELVILEAMKMENPILAPKDGTIASVNVSKGDTVEDGTVLVVIN